MTGLPEYLTSGDQARKTVLACAWVMREMQAFNDSDLLALVVQALLSDADCDWGRVESVLVGCADLIDAIELCSEDPDLYAHSIGERVAVELVVYRELALDDLTARLYAEAAKVTPTRLVVAS